MAESETLEQKLQSVLSDPAQMSQIMAMANALGSAVPAQQPNAETADSSPVLPVQILQTSDGGELRLLQQIRPLVSQRGQAAVDRAIRAVRLSRLARSAIAGRNGVGGV